MPTAGLGLGLMIGVGADSRLPTFAELYSMLNGIQAAEASRILDAWTFLSNNNLAPDDALFLRTGYQPSATSPKSITGLTAVSGGTPTMSSYGLSTNGTSQYFYLTVSDVGAYTLVADMEGYDSGQPTTSASLWSVGGVNGLTTGGGQSLQILTGGEKPAAVFTRNGAGSAAYTNAFSDNGDNLEVGGYLGDPQVVYQSYDNAATPTLSMGVNGLIRVTDSTGNYQDATTLTRLTFGGWNFTNSSHFGNLYKAVYSSIFFYRRVLTESEFAVANKAMHILDPREIVLVVQGDSNSSKRAAAATTSDNWPDQLIQQNSYLKSLVRLVNHAQNGTQSDTASTNYSTRVAPYAPNGTTYDNGIYAQMYGTNDILFNSLTGAQIYANRKSAMDSARAAGFKGVHLTVINALTKGAFSAFTAPQQTKRTDLNNAVATGYGNSEFEYFVDLRTVAALEEPVGAFYTDGLHPNASGYRLIKEEVAAIVPIPGAIHPRCTTKPVITGTGTLTCSTGTWTNSPSGYSYQWYSVTSGASGTITAVGTDSNSYDASGETGNRVFCRVTATNASGSESRSSELTATIA